MNMGTVFQSEEPSLVFLGLSAAAQATNDALDRGMSQKQAFWNGLAAGIFEGVFEKWSIGNFRGLKEVASTHAKDIAKNIAKSMLVNASEETLTEIANIAYDSIVNGDFSQYETKVRQYVLNGMTETEAKTKAAMDLGGQVVEAGASGALMGFGFGAIGSASSVVRNAFNQVKSNQVLKGQEYAQLKDAAPQNIAHALSLNSDNIQAKQLMAQLNSGKGLSTSDLQTLRTLAEESAAVTSKTPENTAEGGVMYSPRAAAENRAFSNGNVANDYASVNQEDVAKTLRSKGIGSKKADGISGAIAARLNGQELTKAQRDLLRSAIDSPTVQTVISNMQKALTTRSVKVSQNDTVRNVGQLNATVQTANNQANAPVNQDDVAKGLLEKGFYSKEAADVAEAIAARLNGQELTMTHKSILSSALSSSAVRDTISEFLKKKADGVDSVQNRVYDKGDIGDRLSNEEKSASWDGYNLEVPSTAHQRELTSDTDALEYASVSEGPSSHQAPDMSSAETDNRDIKSGKALSNGQSLDNMAELYAQKVHSNRKWRWVDAFPNAGKLSKRDKTSIKKRAVEKGLIPDVPVKVVKNSSKKTYRYVDFYAAGLVKEKMKLPEHLWSETDKVQFKWLDDKIGGRPKGYTWHHTEMGGQMELVPTGVHRVYHHNGGRTVNHWAYRKGGR